MVLQGEATTEGATVDSRAAEAMADFSSSRTSSWMLLTSPCLGEQQRLRYRLLLQLRLQHLLPRLGFEFSFLFGVWTVRERESVSLKTV
jgi:hypothetical protein